MVLPIEHTTVIYRKSENNSVKLLIKVLSKEMLERSLLVLSLDFLA